MTESCEKRCALSAAKLKHGIFSFSFVFFSLHWISSACVRVHASTIVPQSGSIIHQNVTSRPCISSALCSYSRNTQKIVTPALNRESHTSLDFTEIDQQILSFREETTFNEAVAVQVSDQNEEVIYEFEAGNQTDFPSLLPGQSVFDQRVGVASTTKIASSLLLLALISNDELRLNSTTGEVLGWTGTKGTITIEMLGFMVRYQYCNFLPHFYSAKGPKLI